ncbi:MAG: hypothetical protein K9M07_01265 [Simkaniaceae bacterium]|nr:hypothetical protein [Simkaniaceae bacterium]
MAHLTFGVNDSLSRVDLTKSLQPQQSQFLKKTVLISAIALAAIALTAIPLVTCAVCMSASSVIAIGSFYLTKPALLGIIGGIMALATLVFSWKNASSDSNISKDLSNTSGFSFGEYPQLQAPYETYIAGTVEPMLSGYGRKLGPCTAFNIERMDNKITVEGTYDEVDIGCNFPTGVSCSVYMTYDRSHNEFTFGK